MAAQSSTDAMKLYDTQYGNVRFPDAFLCHFPPTFTPIRVTLPSLNPAEAPLEHFKPMIKILPITDEEYQYWIPIILGILSILGTTLTGLHLTSHHAIPLASTTPLVIITGGSLLGIGLFAYAYYGHVQNQKREEFLKVHPEYHRLQKQFKLANAKFRTFEITEEDRYEKIENIRLQLQQKEEELQLKGVLTQKIAQIDASLDYLRNYEAKKKVLDSEIYEFNQKLKMISDPKKVDESLSKTRQEIESRKQQLLQFPSCPRERTQQIITLTDSRNTFQKQLEQRLLVDETKLQAEIDSLKHILQQLENSSSSFFTTSIEKHSEQHRQMLFEDSKYLKSRAQAIINAQQINILDTVRARSDISQKLTIASNFIEQAHLMMLHETCQYYVELTDVLEKEYELVKFELNYQKKLLEIDSIFISRKKEQNSLIAPLEERLNSVWNKLSIYRELRDCAIALENSTKEAEEAQAKLLQVRHSIPKVPDAYATYVSAEAAVATTDVDYTKMLLKYYQQNDPQKESICRRNLDAKQDYADKYVALNKALELLVDLHEKILKGEEKIRQAIATDITQLTDIENLFEEKNKFAETMIQVRKAQAEVIQVQCNLNIKSQRDVDQANLAILEAERYLRVVRQEIARSGAIYFPLLKQAKDAKPEDRIKLQFSTTDMELLKTSVLQLKY